MLAAQVLAVEVGRVAVAVPPGAVVEGGAVVLRVVVVAVFGGELHAVVLQQRVTWGWGMGGQDKVVVRTKEITPVGRPHRREFQLRNPAHLSCQSGEQLLASLPRKRFAYAGVMRPPAGSGKHQITQTQCPRKCSISGQHI